MRRADGDLEAGVGLTLACQTEVQPESQRPVPGIHFARQHVRLVQPGRPVRGIELKRELVIRPRRLPGRHNGRLPFPSFDNAV